MSYSVSCIARLRRHGLTLLALVAIIATLLPTAAFASGLDRSSLGAPQASTGRYDRGSQWYNRGDQHRNDWEGHHSTWDGSRDRWDRKPSWGHDGGKRFDRCDATYRVRRGDTLTEIARHFRVSIRALMQSNNLRNANRIFAGQVLCIP
jgi:hypothetical protein